MKQVIFHVVIIKSEINVTRTKPFDGKDSQIEMWFKKMIFQVIIMAG